MKLEGKIGLAGGVALVVGGVIGMGVYALIPNIAANAGYASWLSIAIALGVSILGVLPVIQLSSALPVAGGGYLWCSRMLHPLAGVLVSFWAVLGGGSSVCVVAYALAELLLPIASPYLPGTWSAHLFAALIIAAFYAFYLTGLRMLTSVQILMSLQLVIALAIYAFAVGFTEGVEYHFSLPYTSTFTKSIILAFNVCLGFQIIAELGEEMKDPKRNIPLSLLIGGVCILVAYIGVTMTYIGIVGADNLEMFSLKESPLIESSRQVLSTVWVQFVALGAVFAALTSFNAGAIALPREIFSMARDKTLPSLFGKVNARTQSPNWAVTVFFAFVILSLLLGHYFDSVGILDQYFQQKKIDYYGFMAVCGIMLMTVFASAAAIRLPNIYPAQYRASYFRMKPWILYIVSGFSILTSGGFVILLATEAKLVGIIYLVFTALVVGYFFYRKQYLAKQGVEIGKYHDIVSGHNQ
ncbi:hypothetical protein BH09BAC1_BH09BAC1_05680 [soil metagenome]